jgi:energy-coupling factor transport system permease protein
VTWALENAIETSDSMRSRGYGLPGRTAYSLYRFDARDRILLMVMLALMATAVTVFIAGKASVMYFPVFSVTDARPLSVIAFACHAAVCLTPLVIDVREDVAWR